MEERPRTAFWMHQAAEYAIGFLLLLTAIRLVGRPMGHALGGGLLFITLAAVSRGPLAAVRWVGRATHRALDFGLAAMLAASPLLLRFDNLGMTILAEILAVAVLVLARRTAYAERPRPERPRPERRPEQPRPAETAARTAAAGARVAGRLVGRAPRQVGRLVGRQKGRSLRRS